ncbi:CheR family methyltransferase [Persephonella sp.]
MCLKDLLDFFYKETGIVFDSKLDIVYRKVENFYKNRGFNDCESFLLEIKNNKKILQELIDFLTVNETYFFREKIHLEIIYEYVKDKKGQIRILSLPSSSGEEAYSIIIYLVEKGFSITKFEIIGVDINSEAVNKAKSGVYPFRSMMNLEESIIEKYFVKKGDKYEIKNIYRNLVKFYNMNLFSPEIYILGKFDIILCRNMFIYFSEEFKEKAMSIFYKLLKDDGILILGHADTVRRFDNFERVFFKGSYIYKKRSKLND